MFCTILVVSSFAFIRDNTLHRLVFEQGGLPDGTELTYRNKGEVLGIITLLLVIGFLLCHILKSVSHFLFLFFLQILLSGYKQGNSIVCHCHKEEVKSLI